MTERGAAVSAGAETEPPHAALAEAMEAESLRRWLIPNDTDWTAWGSRVEMALWSRGFTVVPIEAGAQGEPPQALDVFDYLDREGVLTFADDDHRQRVIDGLSKPCPRPRHDEHSGGDDE